MISNVKLAKAAIDLGTQRIRYLGPLVFRCPTAGNYTVLVLVWGSRAEPERGDNSFLAFPSLNNLTKGVQLPVSAGWRYSSDELI